MTNTNRPIRRALVSVFHKEGIEVLAEAFVKAGTEVVSTGSTAKKLAELGVKVTEVSDVTGFPECLDGRVKTLHPYIHAGILADMTNPEHAKQLEEFGIPYEVKVASAHRKPAEVHEWASGAEGRGMRVIVAAAGKAAHLGGVVAAYTPLPVIAVPMKTSDLGGLDSLLSMVQMPSGVPVACVAINGAKNAAILAVQMLGTGCDECRKKISDFKAKMAE